MIESWIDEDVEYLDSMIRDEIDQCIKSINIIDGIVGGGGGMVGTGDWIVGSSFLCLKRESLCDGYCCA